MPWKFYADAACTQEMLELKKTMYTDHREGALDDVIYWANVEDDPTDTGSITAEATSNPGVDALKFTIQDSAVGAGHEADSVKLASTAAGLDTAVAGAALDTGLSWVSGVSNKLEIHIRQTGAVQTVGDSNELAIEFTAYTERATV